MASMTKVRLDFDIDIKKILKKRFKIILNDSTINISERINLPLIDIANIKNNYVNNEICLHGKKIEQAIVSMVTECSKILLKRHINNITTIILEMIKPIKKINEKYITITEFSNISKISSSTIKKELLYKKYLSSKFVTIPTKTAICKEIVKIKQYKHFKNPDLDLIFYWKKSFLVNAFKNIKDTELISNQVKTFKYRSPKNIHEAVNSINHIVKGMINFKKKYQKKFIYAEKDGGYINILDYSNKYLISSIHESDLNTLDEDTLSNKITKFLEYTMIHNAKYLDDEMLSIFKIYKDINEKKMNRSYFYIHKAAHDLFKTIQHSTLHHIWHTYDKNFFIYNIEDICSFLKYLKIPIDKKMSGILAIEKYITYIKKNNCGNNCSTCNRWKIYKVYSSFLYNTLFHINNEKGGIFFEKHNMFNKEINININLIRYSYYNPTNFTYSPLLIK